MLCGGIVFTAAADPIAFTQSGVGSGTIGDVAFFDASFSITSNGDADTRGRFVGGFFLEHDSSRIVIEGVGAYAFTTGTRTFLSNDPSIVGYSRAGDFGSDLFNGPADDALAAWDMLGPIMGEGNLFQWDDSTPL